MPFTKKDWKDGKEGGTPLSAAALEDMEERLSGYTDEAAAGLGLEFAEFHAVRRNLDAQIPTLTKIAGNPIFTVPTATFNTGQWPCIVNVVQDTGAVGPYGERYRIYYSTDHEDATAKVGLLTCASKADLLAGQWTDRGEIFKDEDGTQSETPSVIWNPDEGLWFMYYHQVGAEEATLGEVTMLATSVDGASEWTKEGILFDLKSEDLTAYPASFGPGYVRPWRMGGKWYAHSLGSGTDFATFALWTSDDGRTWAIYPRVLGNGNDLTGPDKRIEWNSGTVIYWNGQLWWIGFISNFTSGGEGRETEYVAAPISSDFRLLLARPTPLFSSLQPWEAEPADNRSGGSILVDADGSLVLAYSGSETGFGIAVGV